MTNMKPPSTTAATTPPLDECHAALAYLSDMVADHNRHIARQEASIQALIAGAMPPNMTHEDFLRAITVTRRFVAPTPPRAVYDSLKATGGMRPIRDTEVIRRLAQYFATPDAAPEYSRRINNAIYATVGGYHPAIISIYDPGSLWRRRQNADFATLATDLKFLEDSVDVLRAMWVGQGVRRNLIVEAERAFEALCRAAPVKYERLETLGASSPDRVGAE